MKPTLFAIATVLPLLAGVIPTAPRRRMCGRRRSRRLRRSQWGRRRRTTRDSGCRNQWNAHEIGPSSWHERHGCARQHRDQSSGARVCFRKWPAGLAANAVKTSAPRHCALAARASGMSRMN
jgi:hypothetical protein